MKYYEMNSQTLGQVLATVVPWPVAMADGADDTAIAPGKHARKIRDAWE